MTRTWIVVVGWVFVMAGAAFGMALVSGQAGAETGSEAAPSDQYDAADGSEIAPPDPGASANAPSSAPASEPASPSAASVSASASATASASASAPGSENGPVDDGLPEDGAVGEDPSDDGTPPDASVGDEPGSAPNAAASASSFAGASASAPAGASEPADSAVNGPADGEILAVDGEDGTSDASASAAASASAQPGPAVPEEHPPEGEASEGADGPDIQPKAGGNAPPDPHPDGPPPAPFEDEPYYDSCFKPDMACGLDVPEDYACDMIYEGELEGKPDRYGCYYMPPGDEDFRYTEGPNGEKCMEKLVYSSRDDKSPETIYDCTVDLPSKKYYLCEYDADWNATRCVKPFKGGDPEEGVEPPYDDDCGEDDCRLDVPQRYECTRQYQNAGKYSYFCEPPSGETVVSPEGEKCRKVYSFAGRGAEPKIFYDCERQKETDGLPEDDPRRCKDWYNEDWEPRCEPGGSDAGVGAMKPSDDAQDAIKDEREEPGGGWQSIRQFGGAVGNAALGFVGVGDGADSGAGDADGEGGAGGSIITGGTGDAEGPGAAVPQATRAEAGRQRGLGPDGGESVGGSPGGTADNFGDAPFGGSLRGQGGASTGSAADEPEARDGDGSGERVGEEVSATSGAGGRDSQDREDGVLSASIDEGPGEGGATGDSTGGASGAGEARSDAGEAKNAGENGGTQAAEDRDGVAGEQAAVLASVRKAAGPRVADALGDGDGWTWAVVAGSGALILGALVLAEMRRRGLSGADRG